MKGLFYILSHYLGSAAMCLQMVACSHIEGDVQAELIEPGTIHQISKTNLSSAPTKSKSPRQFASNTNTGTTLPTATTTAIDSVYICKSRTAYAYHDHYCSGLKRCKSDVDRIPLSSAKEMGYKACGYCY